MTNTKTSIKVPGKLFIIGEYAILEPGCQAILMTLDRYLKVEISPGTGMISSDLSGLNSIKYTNGSFEGDLNGWEPVISSIQVMNEFSKKQATNLDINITSELTSEDGRKYGLGSSGAVVVGVIQALLKHLKIELSSDYIFKLAAIAVIKTGSNSSLADLAALVYGGIIRYQNFDRQWLKKELNRGKEVTELLNTNWDKLEIERLSQGDDLKITVAWTGEPASTENLVAKFWKNIKAKNLSKHFITESQKTTNIALKSWKEGNWPAFIKEINNYQELISYYDDLLEIGIMSGKLKKLQQIASNYSLTAKFSGAGGGDCGLIFSDNSKELNSDLISDLKAADIGLLDYNLAPLSPLSDTIDSLRKNDHYQIALEEARQWSNKPSPHFSDIRFVHRSLAGGVLDEINLSTHWAGSNHQSPLYINAMTGGSNETMEVNKKLAQLAHELNLPIASGSVSIALKDPSTADSFKVLRKYNPHGFIMANLGAHHNLENAKRAVDLLDANAIQIHLNTPQEIVMPEGDRDLSGWIENIKEITQGIDVPVIVKETGFGMSRETYEDLISIGVKTVDISGRGGTNFAQIENIRNQNLDFSCLEDFGQTTAESLLEAQNYLDELEILASGGIRHYWDAFKCLSLGARGVGIAGLAISLLDSIGLEETINEFSKWEQALKQLMLMVGAYKVEDLTKVPIVVTGSLKEWCELRGVDLEKLANRK